MVKITFSLFLAIARTCKLKGYSKAETRAYLKGLIHGSRIQDSY